jgi:aspartyl-tRNA(Asn)/glutamyl-tRNA(Gln) amidotransferase subunit A
MRYIEKPFVDWDDDERISFFELQYKTMSEAGDRFNAFITLRGEEEVLDEFNSRKGPLKGLLLPVKDNISTIGIRTTCASKILDNYIPVYDAHVVEVLKKAGAVVLGKTNMDEFAMGNTGETSYYGPTKNPWDPTRVPGGSSSGSAVAVAWGGMIALGSDTGGSIRQPASYTGVLGLKPTYGLVSRYGLISYAESLEQIGPIARYPRDLALIHYYLTDPDERDITMVDAVSRERVRDRLLEIASGKYRSNVDLEGISFAYSSKLVEESEDYVKKMFFSTLDFLSELGAETVDIDAGFLKASLSAYYIIAMVEASSNLARYDGSNYGRRVDADTYWDMVGDLGWMVLG